MNSLDDGSEPRFNINPAYSTIQHWADRNANAICDGDTFEECATNVTKNLDIHPPTKCIVIHAEKNVPKDVQFRSKLQG